MSELPKGWTETELGAIAAFVMGQAPPGTASNFDGVGTPFVKAGEFGEVRPVIREWTTMPLKMAEEGDVLICVVGATSGKINLGANCAIGRSVAAIRPSEAIDQFYLHSFMKTQVEALRRGSTGTAQGVISSAMLSSVPVPLAPLPEQKRIVVKVDGLTARTARARADLDRIPTLIAHYKQCLLALAFSGELTAAWRQARGLRNQTQTLPEGWSVRELGDISEIQGGIQVGKKRSGTSTLVEVPYLRVANVQRGWLNLDEVKSISVTESERDRLRLESGDVLMNEGGDRDKLGRGWVWEAQVPVCIHQNHVFRIRLNDKAFPPQYISHFANENGQKYFFDQGTQTTNLASVSKRKVAALPVPLPPAEEAIEIVRLIASAFNWLDRMAADHAAASNCLPQLDAAILAKAFRGELVPQDPNDEPATALLARIKAQRENSSKTVREVVPAIPKTIGPRTPGSSEFGIHSDNAPIISAKLRVGASAMTKSRQDDDVMGRPYLAHLLKAGHGASAQDLFKAADLPVADFYKQLAWEIAQKHIRDDDEKLEAL